VSCLVSAIVVAYASEDMVAKCLSSVERALTEVDGETEAIVVLNRPMDGLRGTLGEPWLVAEPGRNLGFAGGVMTALAKARGEWIALVNDDCVVEPGAIKELLTAGATGADVGSVAAQILFADRDDTINSAGLEVDELGIAHERLLGERPAETEADAVDVFGACAATCLYRRAMLDQVGGFDESFFAYLEDADLAWRARMAGWRCLYASRAVVRHRHSSTLGHRSSEKYILVGRNRVRMLAKNAPTTLLLRRGLQMLVYDLGYIAYVACRERTLAPLRGRVDGLCDWCAYRRAGGSIRQPVRMVRRAGLPAALGRDRAYRRG
jgi:GT2 family glycosyltransferase